jgi:hypothetical protein
MSGTASDVHVEGIEKMIPAHTHMPRTSGNIVRARNNMRAHHYTDISATRVFQRGSKVHVRAREREDDVRQSALAAFGLIFEFMSPPLFGEEKKAR